MSLWKIAWRSIQQRGLASSLTGMSMALGVMLVVAVLVIHGTINDSFLNNSSLGYNVLVGAKGGRLELDFEALYLGSERLDMRSRVVSLGAVAVMPEPKEVELTLTPADVTEHVTTAQGPGGQNVNKVATAVHLIHRPTGIEVRMQETKSQSQNREKAWRLLRARLYELELAKQRAAESAQRLAQIDLEADERAVG